MNERSQAGIPGEALAAAFPLGGIGTGNVSVGARGELRDWEIFNVPGRGTTLPFTFFALRAALAGEAAVTRLLESRLLPPHELVIGYAPSSLGGLPRLRKSRLRGEYPLVSVAFDDDELPVSVCLEAFTPLVPMDAAESGLPAAVLRYRVSNRTDAPVDVTVAGSLFNAVGFVQASRDELVSIPVLVGEPRNAFRDDGSVRGLYFSSSLSDDDLRHGTMALMTSASHVTARPDWPASWPGHGLEDLWVDLCEDGRLETTADAGADWLEARVREMEEADADEVFLSEARLMVRNAKKARAGSLAVSDLLTPGNEQSFEFVLAWHFPNRPKAWHGWRTPGEHREGIVRNFYATRFGDAWEVGRYLHDNASSLERKTRAFHASLYDSTLPVEVVDAVASNVATLRSTTCFRLEDGTFAGWEGSLSGEGSCFGNCTHVWNYAQTAAYLFPELERSMRRVEFQLEVEPDGKMNFRTTRIFGGRPMTWLGAAVDGQLGAIVRLYREWKFSNDEVFLAELWPNAVRALEYAFDTWDTDGDGVLDGRQHNTYDHDLHGANPLANAIFFAALRAAAEMAEHVGETDRAERYRNAAAQGAERMDSLLWNGEYYIQRLDDTDALPYQFGGGCLSDQLFGQLLAHVTGLGYVLPSDHVKQAIAAVFRHNFRPQLHNHVSYSRTYALEDEGGLVLCSWPHGRRPRRPFLYADEVFSGVEYQVAAHLIYEGFVDDGLEIVRAVRARHDGFRRSPWNEAEAGYHYVRSMASWALLLAYSGLRYDARDDSIAFAPAGSSDLFSCFFSAASSWGLFTQDRECAQVELKDGSLKLSRIELQISAGRQPTMVSVNSIPVAASIEGDEQTAVIYLEDLTLTATDKLRIELREARH